MMFQLRDALVELWKEFNLPLLAPLASNVPSRPSVTIRSHVLADRQAHLDGLNAAAAAPTEAVKF
jgi:hypothetical protein